jgi:hypothetical protein
VSSCSGSPSQTLTLNGDCIHLVPSCLFPPASPMGPPGIPDPVTLDLGVQARALSRKFIPASSHLAA